jgi:hypothetical protein
MEIPGPGNNEKEYTYMTENYTQGNPQGVSLASVFQEEDQALSSRRKFHASYLNLLDGTSPFPKAFDEPAAPRAICEAVQAKNGGFIVSQALRSLQ